MSHINIRLKEAKDFQESYIDGKRIDRISKEDYKYFKRVRPSKSTFRFVKGTKLSHKAIEIKKKDGTYCLSSQVSNPFEKD